MGKLRHVTCVLALTLLQGSAVIGLFGCCSMQMFLIDLQRTCSMERYLLRNIAAVHDQSSILIAHSTEVSHWPSGHDARKKLPLDVGKCGVSHRMYGDWKT